MGFQRLKDESDDDYVPPKPKWRRRESTVGSGSPAGSVGVATLGQCTPPQGSTSTVVSHAASGSHRTPKTSRRPRPPVERLVLHVAPEKAMSTSSACGRLTNEDLPASCFNANPGTPFNDKTLPKMMVAGTGNTNPTENEGQGDDFLDLDEYFQMSLSSQKGRAMGLVLVWMDRGETSDVTEAKGCNSEFIGGLTSQWERERGIRQDAQKPHGPHAASCGFWTLCKATPKTEN
ncbi:hypothetical protein B0H11DRAFT_1905261 [Mycena galericulata]|nr:hypothetical protein B0H11DRAFT_1905261 [Mycena galericulata]